MCERVEKNNCLQASFLFFFLYNYAYFLDFRAQKFPLIFFNLNPF